MAKKLAFSLELEGSKKLISNLTNVELELSSIGKRLRQVKKDLDVFNNGTKEQREELLKSGKSVESLTQEYKGLRDEQLRLQAEGARLRTDLRQQAKDFDRVKQGIPDDSLIGLRRRYEQLRKEINVLGKEARELPENLKKIKEAESVKKQIDDIGASVRDFRTNVGNYKEAIAEVLSTFSSGAGGSNSGIGAIVDPLANILGGGLGAGPIGAIGGLTNALGPYGVAISAAITATGALVGYVADVTLEFEKLNNQVTNTTQLVSTDLQEATVGVKTLAEVFDKDFNEVLQAANTLTKEVTGDFTESIELIKLGFLAGADANGEFLDSIREYSTQIREAGANGEQFIQILVRAQREGIYSDKGVDLIKEFGNRIRQQTDSTKKALEDAFGEDFTSDLFDGINDGSETTVTALTKVSKQLKTNQLTAKQSQQVVADVFGGPGEDAGLRFIKILEEVDGNLEGLVDSTSAYTQRQLELYDATEELNTQQQILAAQFAGTGFSMDTLKVKAKGLGTTLLNEVLLTGRSIVQTFKDGNIVEGISAIIDPATARLTTLADERARILKEDADKLADVRKGEREAAEERRKAATEGKLGIQDLREEQAKLRKEIDESRVKGEDYTEQLKDYEKVTKQISEATKLLNTNIKKTKDSFQEIAADGSIDQLTDKVRDLQKQLNLASPNKAKELIDELNQAELDLSQAKKELEDFKEDLREANLDNLPIEDQVEFYKEQIEVRRQLELQYAQERIENERILTEELSKINLEKDIESLNEEIKLLEEGSSEYLRTINEINSKKDEIEDIEIRIQLIESEETIEEARLIRERLLTEAFEDEEQLQARIKLLRTNTDIASLQERLRLEELTNIERLQLEQDLQEKLKLQREQQARVDLDIDAREDQIDTEEQENISAILPEFDPNNIEASLQALREFEEQKKIIGLEAQIERFNLERELKIAQGEETLTLDNEIAQRQLELEELKNSEIIKSQERRLAAQQKLEQDYIKISEDLIGGAADLFSEAFAGNLETAEDAQKAFLKLMLDTVEKVVLAQIASASAQSFAQGDSVATFGASGAIRAAILTALIKGAFSVAKSAILSSEDGNVLGMTQGRQSNVDFKRGDIFRGGSHKQGGIKFLLKTLGGGYTLNEAEGGEPILTKRSFKKWSGLISAINEDGGGKKLSSDSDYWKNLLRSLEVKRYASGDVTGIGPVNSNQIPQLVNPNTTINAIARIPQKDIEDLVTTVVEEQVIKLIPTIDGIADKVVQGLQEDNRLKERLSSAQANAEL